jgi:hypothetical protein
LQAASITAEHQKLLNHILQIQAKKDEELQTLTCRLNKSEKDSKAFREWSKNMLQLQHVVVKTRLTKIDEDNEKNQGLVQQTLDVVAEIKKNIAVIANVRFA